MTGRSPWGGEGGGGTPGSKEEEGDGTLLPPPQAGIGSTPADILTGFDAPSLARHSTRHLLTPRQTQSSDLCPSLARQSNDRREGGES